MNLLLDISYFRVGRNAWQTRDHIFNASWSLQEDRGSFRQFRGGNDRRHENYICASFCSWVSGAETALTHTQH